MARKLAVILHRMWIEGTEFKWSSKEARQSTCIEPNSTSGNQRPCRDAGVGAIAPGFAMLKKAKRASHIDPPASSYAIMRRASPYRGENPGAGEDVEGELNPGPELENSQDQNRQVAD